MPVSDAEIATFVAQLISNDKTQAKTASNQLPAFLAAIMSDLNYDTAEVLRRLENIFVHAVHAKYNTLSEWFKNDHNQFMLFRKGLNNQTEELIQQWSERVEQILGDIYHKFVVHQVNSGNRKRSSPYPPGPPL